MSALDDLLKVVHDESFSQDMYDLGETAAAELLALRERVAKLELAIINALNPGEPKALEILEAALKSQ